MKMYKPGYSKAIIVGGLVAGLLSGMPCISIFNCFCCMWVILGGVVAARTYVNAAAGFPSPPPGGHKR